MAEAASVLAPAQEDETGEADEGGGGMDPDMMALMGFGGFGGGGSKR